MSTTQLLSVLSFYSVISVVKIPQWRPSTRPNVAFIADHKHTICMTEIHQPKTAVRLKPGKEKAIRHRHHWIFSGAVASFPPFQDGAVLPVEAYDGRPLGAGYFNRKASIVGRMLTFDDSPARDAIRNNMQKAIAMRQAYFDSTTTAYRVINAEGDCLPGLIVDRYADTLVMQITTLGMEKLKSFLVETLVDLLHPTTLYEKSLVSVRKEEGLKEQQGVLFGPPISDVLIRENDLQFAINIPEGQKTGFFLDHRQMRQRIRTLAHGKRVLNCFAYTGGFSVYAAAGGAKAVTSVDISAQAIAYAEKNMALNNYSHLHTAQVADVFNYLREQSLDYDLIILDPPAFAKRQKDIVPACRGYKDINRIAMQKMPPRSILLTSSCSYYVDEALFQKVVFQAAVEAGRVAKIIGRHELAIDHPINLCHPEGDYLKSLLLYVE
jgi:23S rRNA (cytosine1962-C5)-methyltransferase